MTATLLAASLAWLQWADVSASVAFLCLLPARLWALRGAPVRVRPSLMRSVKRLSVVSLLLALLANVVDVSSAPLSRVGLDSGGPGRADVFSAVAALLAGIGVCVLSPLEHDRWARPSDLLVLYLLVSVAIHSLELWFLLGADGAGLDRPSATRSTLLRLVPAAAVLATETPGKGHVLKFPSPDLGPEDTSGLLQRSFFWWINPILARGSLDEIGNRPLLDSRLSSEALVRSMVRAWDRRGRPESPGTLPRVLMACLGGPFGWAVPTRLAVIAFRYSQPLLMREAIRLASQPTPPDNAQKVWLLAAALAIYCGGAISAATYRHQLNRLKVMTRGALVGLVYTQTLQGSDSGHDAGRAVTLMNGDVDGLVSIAEMALEAWSQALEVLIGMAMLWSQVRWLWPVPLVIIFFCSRVSRFVAQNLRTSQKHWNESTQKRLSAVSSFLSSIMTVKMLGISDSIAANIADLRLVELGRARRVRWISVVYNVSANALGIFAAAITMILYGIVSRMHGTRVAPETAFTTIAVLALVTHPANMVMTFVPRIISCLASFERIQEYLLETRRHDERVDLPGEGPHAAVAIELSGVAIRDPATGRAILEDASATFARSSIVACSGKTGSGKTLLARAILGEVTPSQGSIGVSTRRIGYCSQSPWLPSGTVREIVCSFAPAVDETRYASAIEASCLGYDLERMSGGDQTEVGSRGMNLSGGQRQRLSLARLLYAACDVAILDDPFSALDRKTERRVSNNLFGPEGVFRTRKTTVIWISSGNRYFQLADSVIVLEDTKLRERRGPWSSEESELLPGDDHEAAPEEPDTLPAQEITPAEIEARKKRAREEDELLDMDRRAGDMSLYGYYFGSTGYLSPLFMLACTATYSFFITVPQYWLKWWTEADLSVYPSYIVGYGLLALFSWSSTSTGMWATHMLLAQKSGLALHSRLLNSVVGAPLSYFRTTDAGAVLNRFSQDIQLVDKDLPSAFLALGTQVSKLTVQICLLLAAQEMLAISLPVCAVVVYIIQKLYLRTSREVRLLELESRSAVFSQILETVEGASTIRAFGWRDQSQRRLSAILDKSQSPFYLLFCLARWLNLVLDLMVSGIATAIIAIVLYLPGSMGGAEVGVALNIILVTNSTLLSLVHSWANLEISMGAVARLRQIEQVPREDKPWEALRPEGNWPSQGEVLLDNVTARYGDDAVALRNVSLRIQPGQKVVICGRTGSGKSTLLQSLLRLVDYTGTITIDGLDLSRLPKSLARRQCFITVPQHPLLQPAASLRSNLDPSSTSPPHVLAGALRAIQLWPHLAQHLPATAGPPSDDDVLDGPLPALSAGQAQLLAVARALVRAAAAPPARRPVVLLDEPTGALDPAADALVHRVIDEQLCSRGHTVIVVAHSVDALRAHARPGRDCVVLMAAGRVEWVGGVEVLDGPGR